MARSDDTRHPLRFQRGVRRYHDIGGHVPPGDDGRENSRDHERIWLELRKRKGCCGCDHPGLKFCFEHADYPTLVCDGLYPSGVTLIDYWPGLPGGAGTDMTLAQGCGATGVTVPELSVTTEFRPNGSWRNGPIFGKRGFGGNATWLGTGASWVDTSWMNNAHTFEFFIKPSSTDIALAKSITASGPSMGDNDGGYFLNFLAGNALRLRQETLPGGAIPSAPDILVPDEWHIIHIVRGTATPDISVYVNGRRVIYHSLATGLSVNSSVIFAFAGGEGSWVSDISRYWGVMPGSEIRRRARVMIGAVGIPDGSEDEEGGDGTIVEDPTFLISDLAPDQIDGEGLAGYVMISTGDAAHWLSPEDSVFELEARKSQPSGYASLDSGAKVPTAEMGTGSALVDTYLSGERKWVPGQVVPKPTALDQMLRAEASPSDDYEALLAAYFSTLVTYPLTEAAAPFADSPAGSWGDLSITGSAAVVTDPDYAFAGETVVEMNGGTDGLVSASAPFASAANFIFAFWVKLDANPASTVNIVKLNGLAGIRLLSTGKVEVWHSTPGTLVTSVSSLPLDQWVFVIGGNDGSGAGTSSAIWINGVQEATGLGQFAGSGNATIVVGGDGLDARIAWLSESGNQLSDDFNAEALALYQARRPVWTVVNDAGGGGVEASKNGADVTAAARGRINLIEGANVALTVADDAVNGEIDVTIAATAPAGSGIEVSKNDADVSAAPRGRLNFKEGSNVTLTVTDDGAGDEVEVTVAAASGVEASLNGADVTAAARGRINFIEGTGIDLTVADDAGNGEVDVTVAATGGGGADPYTRIVKASDESVASSIVLQDDNDFSFLTTAGKLYEIDVLLRYGSPVGGTAPDLKLVFGEDTTSRGLGAAFGYSNTDAQFTGFSNSDLTDTIIFGTAVADRTVRLQITHVGNGGTFKIQWAQNASNANPTIVRAGSEMAYRATT